MDTVKDVLQNTIASIMNLRRTINGPVHALIWGAWGTGKTYVAQELAKSYEHVFYIKVPDGDISKGRLLRLIGFAIGSGARHSYETTLDLLISHCEFYSLNPILILDEAQRLLRKPLLLNELKDLAEINSLNFSYIMLGDKTIPKLINTYPHSIHKRILIRKELDNINPKTVAEISKEYKLSVNAEEIAKLAKQRGWTTIDVVFVIQVAKRMGLTELSVEQALQIAQSLGR